MSVSKKSHIQLRSRRIGLHPPSTVQRSHAHDDPPAAGAVPWGPGADEGRPPLARSGRLRRGPAAGDAPSRGPNPPRRQLQGNELAVQYFGCAGCGLLRVSPALPATKTTNGKCRFWGHWAYSGRLYYSQLKGWNPALSGHALFWLKGQELQVDVPGL